jgi:hypothetical protein
MMPAGFCFAGGVHDASRVTFLSDKTWVDPRGIRHTEQQIFDAVFDAIRGARKFVLLDMFYYNDFQRGKPDTTRLLSSELTDVLLQQKKTCPDMTIVVITDPINTVYGSLRSAQFALLHDAGIPVVFTDLSRLRDSNPTYSVFWRLFVKPLGNSEGGFLPNPFDPRSRATFRSYLALLNYKANHRKVLVEDLLASENAVLHLSGEKPVEPPVTAREQLSGVTVQILTERAVKTEVLRITDETQPGDRIDLAMFFLSDRDVIAALIGARRRGVSIRVLLDPNKDSFGHRKYGIPNRPVAAELVKAGIDVCWGDTHGEQCHAKMMLVETTSGQGLLLLGSANMTRRNLDNFNLETSALVRASSDSEVLAGARRHFDLLWNNTDERIFSAPYEDYRNESVVRKWLYRFMEASGWSTF